MPRPTKKYERGKGGTRIFADLNEKQFKEISSDLDLIEKHIESEIGTSSRKAAIISSIKHYAKHVREGDFED